MSLRLSKRVERLESAFRAANPPSLKIQIVLVDPDGTRTNGPLMVCGGVVGKRVGATNGARRG